MTDRAKIIDTFNEIEKDAGGYAAPAGDAQTVALKVANRLGLTYEQVKEVLLDEWTRTV